jgi:hypothetical protein
VLGGQVSSATVIDTDQIIFAASRIGFKASVKKNDGDSGSIKSSHDPIV